MLVEVLLGVILFAVLAEGLWLWQLARAQKQSDVAAAVLQSERDLRDELSRVRLELATQMSSTMSGFSAETNQKLELLRTGLGASGDNLQTQVGEGLDRLRTGLEGVSAVSRQEAAANVDALRTSVEQKLELLRSGVDASGKTLQLQLNEALDRLRTGLETTATASRQETATAMEGLRTSVEARLKDMSADNEKRLEQMRQTVEEKLQGTLETRLGESFRLVSERLEQVHKGLGEMQTLASGVGDLKRVLTNVKARGTWGEVQLGALLEQVLIPEQYAKNVSVTGTLERVEYAIKLPGRNPGEHCWLPVDAKFPVEDYQRLMEAAELGDVEAVEAAGRRLETTLKLCARTINEKYLMPPATTDFGILFLATEGLYAEALRRPGLADTLQRDYHVVLSGPTTFAALLNSLQMGFRTLAIQQRSSEVWETLGKVKTEFKKYAEVLAKVKKKLDEASSTVDDAETRTRVLRRRLEKVEESGFGIEPEQVSLLEAFELESMEESTPGGK